MQRRLFVQGLAVGAGTLEAGLSRAAASIDEKWFDNARGRDVPVRVRWPDGDARCALVVHSHGLGGNREGGDAWAQVWRGAGFAVINVQHPGSDTEAFRGGLSSLRAAASAEQLIARVADMRFVLDEVERRARDAAGPWARVRSDAIGASGHSFGAQTVQALAGKNFGARAAPLAEPRYRAFIAFSPAPGRGEKQPLAEQFAAITRPFLAITGTLDGDPLPGLGGATVTPEQRASLYDALPSGQRALLLLDGADHMTFGGNAQQRLRARFGPLRREAVAAAREPAHHALVARISTLWWQAYLLGDRAALDALRAPAGLGADDRWRRD